jgi:FkbM family methyltransferase
VRSRFKYYKFKEILVLSLGLIFNKILLKLQYQQKYLPIRNEINYLLKNNFTISRKNNNILICDTQKDNQKYLLRPLTSDSAVLQQVIIEKEYFPMVKLIEEKGLFKSIRFIVDAGSNIGLTSIYFNGLFSSALIVSIEPEESNYLHQLKNIRINNCYDKIIILKKALWINNTDSLIICDDFRDGGNWSKSVKKSNEENITPIPSITLSDIISTYSPHKIIDLLKIDIEGTERELFESNDFIQTIANSVRFLCLEIHDEFNIREKIRKILTENNIEFFDMGETTFCYNKNLSKNSCI